MRLTVTPFLTLLCLAAPPESPMTVSQPTPVPQAVLKPGRYAIVVEDSLADRKVIRIADSAGKTVAMFLAAPNPRLRAATAAPFVYWPNGALRAWKIPGEAVLAEAVYEKNEALKLAELTGEPVPAIDPEGELSVKDRRLTRDDLRVLNLWQLDYGPVTASARKLAAAKLETAVWRPSSSELSRTASPYGGAILAGVLLLTCAALLRTRGPAMRVSGQ